MTAQISNVRGYPHSRDPFDIDLIPLRLERVTPAKLLNWLLTEASVYVKPGRPWDCRHPPGGADGAL